MDKQLASDVADAMADDMRKRFRETVAMLDREIDKAYSELHSSAAMLRFDLGDIETVAGGMPLHRRRDDILRQIDLTHCGTIETLRSRITTLEEVRTFFIRMMRRHLATPAETGT